MAMFFFEKWSPLKDQTRRDQLTLQEFTEHFAPRNRRPGARDQYVVGYEEICSGFQPGDELYVVVSDQRSWEQLRGRANVEHVRGGKVIGGIVVAVN